MQADDSQDAFPRLGIRGSTSSTPCPFTPLTWNSFNCRSSSSRATGPVHLLPPSVHIGEKITGRGRKGDHGNLGLLGFVADLECDLTQAIDLAGDQPVGAS